MLHNKLSMLLVDLLTLIETNYFILLHLQRHLWNKFWNLIVFSLFLLNSIFSTGFTYKEISCQFFSNKITFFLNLIFS